MKLFQVGINNRLYIFDHFRWQLIFKFWNWLYFIAKSEHIKNHLFLFVYFNCDLKVVTEKFSETKHEDQELQNYKCRDAKDSIKIMYSRLFSALTNDFLFYVMRFEWQILTPFCSHGNPGVQSGWCRIHFYVLLSRKGQFFISPVPQVPGTTMKSNWN